MDIKDCIEFTNGNTLCYYETVEDEQPRIRAIGSWFADKTGFYFQTEDIKSLYDQFQRNSKSEICFYKQENMNGSILRISGEFEFLSDLKLKEKFMNDIQVVKALEKMVENPGLMILWIAHGFAHLWTMENNIKPKETISF
jgi:pyridoxamine 5'-phosphate oxidase